jgi:O-antigen ligase
MLAINLGYTVFCLNQFNLVNGIFSVYYISSGHFGASLVILSSYFLVFKTTSKPLIPYIVLLIGLVLGLFAIYISSARSPVLALMVVGLYFVLLKKKMQYLYSFIIFLLLSVILIYILRQFFHLDSAFLERNYTWIFEGNASGRAPYFNRAIAIFKDNILIGGRVLYEDGMYPHNVFLELLMSGGLLLLLIFSLFFYPLLKNIRSFIDTTHSKLYILPLFALWLQYFILTLTSFSIHSNPEFWYFSSVIIGISIRTHHEKT